MSHSDHQPTVGTEEPAVTAGPPPSTSSTEPANPLNSAHERVPPSARIEEDDSDAAITEKLRRQGVRLGKGLVAPAVFWPALIIIAVIALVAMFFPEGTGEVIGAIQGWIVAQLGWLYVLVIALFIAFALVVCFSKFGRIKLGRDDDKPEFGWLTWFCMLFAAGMGIGLVFYGVGEPLGFSTTIPKPGWPGTETVDGLTSVIPGSEGDVAMLAMAQTFVHWGLHPWAIYAVIGLALAYAIHRRGRPVSIRWALEPIFGDRVKGTLGDVIDIIAIFGTIFGICTSLGLGVSQIASGLQAIGVVGEFDNLLLIILIIVITLIATGSVISGLGKGIKWLSNINLSLAGILLISVLLLGPTVFLFQNFVQSIGAYLANVMDMTFDVALGSGDAGESWVSGWTLFYWGWWVSWAPFVGVFIARISKGRTVRQFIAGVLLVPTLVGFFWFSVMGGAGLFRQFVSDEPLVPEGAESFSTEAALFDVLGALGHPVVGGILSVLAIIVVAIFFITSSDSGSLVVDMLASGGHPNPPLWSRVLWALLEGALAVGLLAAGGLGTMQAASLITALPFSIILVLMCVATVKALGADHAAEQEAERRARYRLFSERLSEDFGDAFGPQVEHIVDDRIDYRLSRTTGVFDRRRDGTATRTADPAAPAEQGQQRGLFGRRRKDDGGADR